MSAIFSSIFTPLAAFFTAIIMAFTNLFGAWFGFIEEPVNPEDPDDDILAIVYETDDPAEVAEFYVEASEKTLDYAYTEGEQSLELVGDITGDGAIGTILEVLNPVIAQALEANSYTIYEVPGIRRGDLQANDISECHLEIYEDGSAFVKIYLKEQVDGSDDDMHESGPVARGIGTLGSIDYALEELGAEISSGRDTISLTYRDAYIAVSVTPEGYIDIGSMGYYVDVLITDAKAKLLIPINLKNISATIKYSVVLY